MVAHSMPLNTIQTLHPSDPVWVSKMDLKVHLQMTHQTIGVSNGVLCRAVIQGLLVKRTFASRLSVFPPSINNSRLSPIATIACHIFGKDFDLSRSQKTKGAHQQSFRNNQSTNLCGRSHFNQYAKWASKPIRYVGFGLEENKA